MNAALDRRIDATLAEMLRSESHREVLSWMLRAPCRMMAADFAQTPEQTFVNMGRRTAGVDIYNRIQRLSPEVAAQLLAPPREEKS